MESKRNIIIRRVRIEDDSELTKVMVKIDHETRFMSREPEESNFTDEDEIEFLKNIINEKDHAMFIAEVDGMIVGFCNVFKKSKMMRYKHRAMIGMGILEKFQSMGVGSKLMKTSIDWCIEQGDIDQIELDVIEDNVKGLGLYKKFGFIETGRIPRCFKYKDGTYRCHIYGENTKVAINQL